MARANSKEKRATQEETLGTILTIPGVVKEPVWRELADEAKAYLELYNRLSKEPLNSLEREALEDNMILSLSHLAVHSQVLYNSIDEAVETHFSEEPEYEDFVQETFEEASEVEIRGSLKIGISAQESLITFWGYLNRATAAHGKEIRAKRLKLEKIMTSKSKQARKEKQIAQVLDSIAAVVEQHTDEISAKLPEYRRNLGKYVGAYSNFIFWLASADYSEHVEKRELHAVTVDFERTLQELLNSLSEYIKNVQNTASSAVENFNHTKLSAACTDLANKLVGILDTVREIKTFTENVLAKLDAGD